VYIDLSSIVAVDSQQLAMRTLIRLLLLSVHLYNSDEYAVVYSDISSIVNVIVIDSCYCY
jgi:hypothetical protein